MRLKEKTNNFVHALIRIIVIAFVWPFFWSFMALSALGDYFDGKRDADMGNAEEAIWKFASSIHFFPYSRYKTEERIRSLYKKHGPFNFDDEFVANIKSVHVDQIRYESHSPWPEIRSLIFKIVRINTNA